MPKAPTLLLTGASRGLGLEFTRQYLALGWRVHACCRDPQAAIELASLAPDDGRLQLHRLDVSEFDAIAALAAQLAGQSIDLLLNNAGLFGPKHGADDDPRQTFGHIDYAIWLQLLKVNALAPLRMAEAFVEHVAAGEQRRIVTISSELGSIANTRGGLYAYRGSKAAVNMTMASLAKDLAPRGIAVGLYCPGWVRTAMGGPAATLAAPVSVAALRQRFAELTPENSSGFWLYDGTPLPW